MSDWGDSKCVGKLTHLATTLIQTSFSNSITFYAKNRSQYETKISEHNFSVGNWFVIIFWLNLIPLTSSFIQLTPSTLKSSSWGSAQLLSIYILVPELWIPYNLAIFSKFVYFCLFSSISPTYITISKSHI